MIRSLLAFLAAAAFLLLASAPASAGWVHGSPLVISPTCPNGVDSDCSGAPTDGVFKAATFFTASSSGYVDGSNNVIGQGIARQSGQIAYAKTPTWNVAGVSFPVGYSQSAFAGGKDPANIASDPKVNSGGNGCAYYSTGSVMGGPLVECDNFPSGGNGGAGLDLEDYDFSLHGCVPLLIKGNNAGPIRIKNNNFKNGPNCTSSPNGPNGAHVTAGFGDAFSGWISGNLLCAAATTQGQIEVDPGDTTFLLDGAGITANTVITAAGGGSCANGYSPFTVNNSQTVGSSSAPVSITERSTSMWVTAVLSGYPGQAPAGQAQTVQADAPAVTTCFPSGLPNGCTLTGSATVASCPGGTCPATTGQYVIANMAQSGLNPQGTWYIPSQNYVLGVSQNYLVEVQHGATNDVTFSQNLMDGDAIHYPLALSSGAALDSAGKLTATYNAFFRIQARPIAAITLNDLDVENNYFEANNYNNPASNHGEIVINADGCNGGAPCSQTLVKYRNNTILYVGTTWPIAAPIWAVNAGSADVNGNYPTITTTDIERNIIVVNRTTTNIPGGSASVALSYNSYGSVTIDSNLIDGVGADLCTNATGGVTGNNGWLTNNYDMVNGKPISSWGQYFNQQTCNSATGD